MVNAVNPKYASVFPPPVGNQIKSTISLSGQSSLYIELRFNKINANWKGLHLPYTFFSLLYKGNRRRATRLARQGRQRRTAQNRNDYNLTDTVWQIGAGERIGPAVCSGVHLLEQPCQIRRIGDKIEKITG